MPAVTIKHPNMPYRINASYSNRILCSIRMDNNIFRIVHVKTGLAIQEFRNQPDSVTFIKRLMKSKSALNYLARVKRLDLKDPNKIKAKEMFEYRVNTNLYDLDVANERQATECRYYNKPAYLDMK